MNILLLEDDPSLSIVLKDFLDEIYTVTHLYTIKETLALCQDKKFDLYLFDINLSDGDGISLLRSLRQYDDTTPTLFITAFDDTQHLKEAFASGGNDFIRKPFALEELQVRIENIKNLFGIEQLLSLTPSIMFNTKEHYLEVDNARIHLSQKESACLHYLYENRHHVVSSDVLLRNLWAFEAMPSDEAIRTLIKQLRKYLGKERIINIWGKGYKLALS